jgi:multidrug transporter EmrE-like cation transporter
MHDWMGRALLAAYVLTATFGLYRMKAAAEIASLGFLAGALCYALSFVLWILILLRMPLSVAFPLVTGLVIVATQLSAALWLNEPLTWWKAAGVVLIISGIGLLAVKA